MREIRRVKMNEQTWYMAADICNEVGISNCTVAIDRSRRSIRENFCSAAKARQRSSF